ncbi:N-acetyltransferase [Occultella glacieicola]|uniref:N-acetyltransferase n=1 Tax=Occultella glacieicola TaxID=2518684 RepID=A0ABY2E962_9MICO|nr:N-acetyltransferase [Occultella glacieicola]TDE99044.1 N-acetyltransferase [Occultella glacieicola]
MPCTDPELEIPERLTTAAFLLRPILATDAELDHAAVMESRDYLRTWEQSSWPEDGFTVAANRKDLEGLEERHVDRRAFTYTVLNPDETECLGCVYLMPTDASMFDGARITAVGNHLWSDYDTAVYFWVRRSALETGTDRVLLDELRAWLARDWSLGGHLIVTSEGFTQQVDLIERTDLQLRFEIEESGKPGRYRAYS